MAASVTHNKVSTIPPSPDPLKITGPDWNEDHDLTDVESQTGAQAKADAAQAAAEATAAGGLSGHLADTVDAHDASAVSAVPFSTIAGTTVQSQLEEIFTEAAGGAHPDLAAHDVLGLATDAELAAEKANDALLWRILAGAPGLTGVVSGAAVTAQGSPNMTVAVAAGKVRVAGRKATVAAGNVTITTAHATLPRLDLIVSDNAGAKSAVAGTAATNPLLPAIPANSVVLANVSVPAADTTISSGQITDCRVTIYNPDFENVVWYGALTNGSDSSAAVQSLIDLYPVGTGTPGATVLFPEGVFGLNSLNIERQALKVVGVGNGTPSNYPVNPGQTTVLQYNGTAGGYMWNIQDTRWISFANMMVLGNRTNQPNDIFFFESVGGSVGSNAQMFLDRVTIGRYPWSNPETTPGDNAVNGIRIGGASNTDNDQFHFTDVVVDHVQNGLVVDNSQSVWGELDNCYFNTCTTAALTTSAQIHFTNLTCNANAIDILGNSSAKISGSGWESENAVQYAKLVGNGAKLSVSGGHLLASASLTTNMFDILACNSNGGLSLKDIYLNMASLTGRKIKARQTAGATFGGVVNIENVGEWLTPANLDIVSGTGPGQLAVTFKTGPYNMFQLMPVSSTLSATPSYEFPPESVVVGGGAALATTATDGFLYLPSCAGVPTGVPTTKTGSVPFVVDSTDGRIYAYVGGAWKYVGVS